MNTKRMAALLTALVFSFLMGGCMNAVELKDRTIIRMIGVDTDEEGFVVTMLQFSPQAKPGEQSSSSAAVVIQTSGRSISEAVSKVSHYNGNEVFLGNSSFLVIGQEAAQQGLEKTLNYFNANHEVSPELYVAMAQGKAESIIRAKSQEGSNPTQLKSLVEQGRRNGLLGRPTLRDVMNRLQSNCSEPYLPVLTTVELDDNEDVLKIVGMAVFRDGRLQDTLSIEQTRGVLWATDELNRALITVDFGKENSSRASVELEKSKSRVKVEIVRGNPVFHLSIRALVGIHEVSFDRGGGAQVNELTEIQDKVAEQIKATVRQTIDRVFFEQKSDVFRYSEFLKKHHPDYWKEHEQDWEKLIEKSRVEIEVTCQIDHPGLENKHHQVVKVSQSS